MSNEKSVPCRFILTGFSQDQEFRVFSFECVGADQVRTQCAVRTDMTLVRTYGIPMQELPLLCRQVLEQHADSEVLSSVTFTEDDMRRHQAKRLASHKPVYRKANQQAAGTPKTQEPLAERSAPDEHEHAGTMLTKVEESNEQTTGKAPQTPGFPREGSGATFGT